MTIEHRVVLFTFAGRRANMELQLPLIKRVLEQHPNVEYDVWDLAFNDDDHRYLQTIEGERITVRNNFYPNSPGYGGRTEDCGFDNVYRYYGRDNFAEYGDCVFVKIDDDVVFLQTERFSDFLAAIDANPGSVISANVINNGACTPIEPALLHQFNPLDIHKSNQYADVAHHYFFDHPEMLGQPVELIPTEDWLSINLIGYNGDMAREIANKVGTLVPNPIIAGRTFPKCWAMADETMLNTLPRMVMRGFLAAHLTFGQQNCTDKQLASWRHHYAEIGRRYLSEAKILVNTSMRM